VLYHCTSPDNVRSIRRHGLKASADGRIYTVILRRLINEVAKTQVFLERYALFGIYAAGVTGEVERDNIGEFIAIFHRVIVQPKIAPKHLRLIGIFDTDFDEPDFHDRRMGFRAGMTSRQIRFWVRRRNQIMQQLNAGTLTLEEGNAAFGTLYDETGNMLAPAGA
jgi:hypothetical protein